MRIFVNLAFLEITRLSKHWLEDAAEPRPNPRVATAAAATECVTLMPENVARRKTERLTSCATQFAGAKSRWRFARIRLATEISATDCCGAGTWFWRVS